MRAVVMSTILIVAVCGFSLHAIAEPPGGLPGDFDGDGDIDLLDYEAFPFCMRGPDIPYLFEECDVFDFDSDADVDLLDWGDFQTVFTGATVFLVEAGTLMSDAASPSGYFNADNVLSGSVSQAGFGPDDFVSDWTIVAQPDGSGIVAVFDPMAVESLFAIAAPATVGEYVFRLSATNLVTEQSASDTVVLALLGCTPVVEAGPDRSATVALRTAQSVLFSDDDVPLLVANAACVPGGQEELLYEWSVVTTPDLTMQPLDTIDIFQPFSPGDGIVSVDVLINPPGATSAVIVLRQNGSTGTQANVPLPGPYVFQISVTTPAGAPSAIDTVSRTISPIWVPLSEVTGSLAGLAATNGIYNTVQTPLGGVNLHFQSLSRVDGSIDFTSVDFDDATSIANMSTESVVASDTVATLMTPVPASTRGTYTVNATLNAGEISVASGATGGTVLVGTDWASTTINTELSITANQIGQPQSIPGGRLYAGVANDVVGGAANTANSEALRGQNILFADIKNTGNDHVIVWGGADVNANYDAQDIRIYKPINNQKGNANTLGFDKANFTFLEQIDTNCTVTDVAIGPLRGDATRPELVVACNATDPLVRVYDHNGATGENDKVYSVRSNQTTAAAPSTIIFDYTNSNSGSLPPQVALAPFTSTSFHDLIFGDAGFDGGSDGFIEGRVLILQGGTAGSIPAPGFSISTGAALANLPTNKWDSYTGIANDANDEPFFGFALATAPFTSTTLHDIYVGAPGNDEANANSMTYNGAVFRIPGGSALNSADATTATLSVSWSGEGSGGDQFGFSLATTPTNQVVVAAPQNGHTANSANGVGKVYVYAAATANAVNAATIPSVAGEQSFDFFGIRLATGRFEGADMLVAASPIGNYFKLIATGGTLSNPIVPMTKVTIVAIDTTSAVVIGDLNGDGKNDVCVSRSAADQVTALWGRQ